MVNRGQFCSSLGSRVAYPQIERRTILSNNVDFLLLDGGVNRLDIWESRDARPHSLGTA